MRVEERLGWISGLRVQNPVRYGTEKAMRVTRACTSGEMREVGRYRMQSRTVKEVTFNKGTKENSPCLREFAFVKAGGT